MTSSPRSGKKIGVTMVDWTGPRQRRLRVDVAWHTGTEDG